MYQDMIYNYLHPSFIQILNIFDICIVRQNTLCKEQEDMDRTHIMKCSVLRRSTEHERYWEARALMSVYN